MVDKKKEIPASSPTKVTNLSSVNLTIDGVKIARGETEDVEDFDPNTNKHAAWIKAKYIKAS